jgi:tRNA-specific 2-thiouridylase
MKKAKAIALLSGGLDSTLAILVLLKQDIEVTAITYLTHFGCDITDSSSCSKDPFPAAERYGFKVKLSHLADKFIDIVKNPKHGHGKNMNPCMDCRILMLREAKQLMELTGADFLVTGEVLGQRPMSQRKDTFPLIDREADVEGLVLRPLSARLLKPTAAEMSGLVNRDMLYGFSGRTRRPQMALAKELGLIEYPAPAGGCLLTDPIYSYRLKELLSHDNDPDMRMINLLQVGRHFRVTDNCKVIIGRNQKENEKITSLTAKDDWILWVENYGSPTTIISGNPDQRTIETAAAMTARYSDAKHLPEVNVTIFCETGGQKDIVTVKPASDDLLDRFRIEQKKNISTSVLQD